MYDMVGKNTKKNVIGMLENSNNDFRSVQNALRDNEEEPKLEVNKISHKPTILQRTMG